MMRGAVAVCLLMAANAAGQDVALEFAGSPGPFRVAVRLPHDASLPQSRWAAFLDKWFVQFDRNQDGLLDVEEAARMPPLPLPSGKYRASAKAAKLTPETFKKQVYDAGFRPLLVRISGPSTEDVGTAEWLRKNAQRDGKWDLSRVMRLLDSDDNETIDEAEWKAVRAAGKSAEKAKIVETVHDSSLPMLSLDAAGVRIEPKLEGISFRQGCAVLAGGEWVVALRRQSPRDASKSGRGFLLSQFEEAAKDGSQVAIRDLENDVDQSALAAITNYADRNGDGVLTRRELEEYFDLARLAANSQTAIAVNDHGLNFFPVLDANQDGRWTASEMLAGRGLVASTPGGRAPRFAVLQMEQPRWADFGGVPLSKNVRSTPQAKHAEQAPEWFRAMDANGDGMVSEREFLGPLSLFRSMDADKNGLISPSESTAFRPR
ncbi:MAG: EF-hand domain-containing protein [Gemmataceae bacterium]